MLQPQKERITSKKTKLQNNICLMIKLSINQQLFQSREKITILIRLHINLNDNDFENPVILER